jgi:hypothetical protein
MPIKHIEIEKLRLQATPFIRMFLLPSKPQNNAIIWQQARL